MATNYAEKYSPIVDELFTQASVTEAVINRNYDWNGTQMIHVYGVDVPVLNNYSMSGANRYGTPNELGNTKNSYPLTQDRAFTFTIDKRSNSDTMNVMEAGSALNRTINRSIVPEVDKYRIGKIVAGAGTTSAPLALTKANVYENFLKAQEVLGENNVPLEGRVVYVPYSVFNLLKQDTNFIKASDMAQNILVKGALGMVDGLNIVAVPSALLPANVGFLVTHKIATVGAEKLIEYITHENPPGINGWLIEGRIYYDAFVLEGKKKAVYVHKIA